MSVHVDRTLTGSVTLESRNRQSSVCFTLTVNHVGHIQGAGRYEINGNVLDFRFHTDQTQLAPLVRWLDSAISKYEKASA